ncbi:MAG: hypothetical protein ACI9LM_003542 [Alteromonadaceae bacterium]|jgi:hypothetical protein
MVRLIFVCTKKLNTDLNHHMNKDNKIHHTIKNQLTIQVTDPQVVWV